MEEKGQASADKAADVVSEPRVIKRYANRKLYDTRESRYVTLPQIADFIRAGDDVQIVDNKTKQDLTTVTLAQIIVDEEKRHGSKTVDRPQAGNLRDFIQHGRERLLTTLREGPVGMIVQRFEGEAEESDASQPPAGAPSGEHPADQSPAQRRSVVASSIDALNDLQHLADGRVKAVISGVVGRFHHLQGEVRRLRTRIEELEARLGIGGPRRDSEQPEPPETVPSPQAGAAPPAGNRSPGNSDPSDPASGGSGSGQRTKGPKKKK